ncbi:MAG: hypothetical protein JNK27_13190 [Chitinophagaceae bacterium]|nr:hypothetical protein [Chitinophagaceae bacterium]
MRRFQRILVFLLLLFASCKSKDVPVTLDKAFLRSFQEGEFTILEKYLPTNEFYKSLGKDVPDRTDTEIDSFLNNSKRKLVDNWNKISDGIKNNAIDPDKISIEESVVYNPYSQSIMQAMIIIYEYNGKLYDDLTLIVKRQNDNEYLLEIPNPLSAFEMKDTSLANSSQAKVALDLVKPAFGQNLQNQIKEMVAMANSDNLPAFSLNIVYHGEDKVRNWKSPVNLNDAAENKMTADLMQKVKLVMNDCRDFSFDKISAEKESEGYWIVQPLNCGRKIVRFAFLRVKDRLLLGDIDVENPE